MPAKPKKTAPRVLHPMASFATVSGMTETIRINRLENRLNPLVDFPHRHDFYQIMIITRGSGWHEIDFERLPIVKHRIFMMCPGQIHSWSLHPKTEGYILEFEAKTFRSKDVRWNQLGRVLHQTKASLLLDKENYAALLNLAATALREYEDRGLGHELVLHACLTQVLVSLSRSITQGSQEHSTFDLYENFMRLLEDNFSQEHSVAFYANALGLTPKALTMRFYREQLRSPRELIQDRCILEAKRLLAYSDLSIASIAEELGFEDANYFTRFFRNKSQSAPGRFRIAARHSC